MLYYGLYSLEHRDGPVKEKVLVGPLVTNFVRARESTRPKYDTAARGDLEVVIFCVFCEVTRPKYDTVARGDLQVVIFLCV